jgi:hypothetical protein
MTEAASKGPGLGPMQSAVHLVFVAFFAGIAVLLLATLPSLKATVVTKLLFAVLAVASVVAAVSNMMWARYRQHVNLEAGFWRFVMGRSPHSGDALLALRWGRRFCASWMVMMLCIGGVAFSEKVAQAWL